MYRLRLRIVDTISAELYLGWTPRVVSAATAALFGLAAIGEGRVYWFPAVLAALALLATLYDEHWRFDTAAADITARSGLLFMPRVTRYPTRQLISVGIAVIGARSESSNLLEQNPIPSVFTRGHCRLELRFADRPTVLVTLERATHRARMEAIAQGLARHCRVDYVVAEAESETR